MKPANPIYTWVISLRIFSLPFIVMPYLMGVCIAWPVDYSSPGILMILTGFIPLMFFHFAGVLQNDVHDYLRGVDIEPNKLSGGIVRKWIGVKEARQAIIVLNGIALLIGVYLTYIYGWDYVFFMIIGFSAGVLYSVSGRFAIKYHPGAEWFIFLVYGMAIPAYGYFIMNGNFSARVLWLSLPAAFLITAMQHANNWIGTISPEKSEKQNLAKLIGQKASGIYYMALVILAYLSLVAIYLWKEQFNPSLPDTILFALLSLPLVAVLIYRIRKPKLISPENNVFGLDSLTTVLYSLFILLYSLGFLVQ